VSHPDGGDLVRHRDGSRQHLALGRALGVGLDDGREVGARVSEEVLDAPRGEQLQVTLGRALDRHFLQHGIISTMLGLEPSRLGTIGGAWSIAAQVYNAAGPAGLQ
jgi:hypothetical protein